MKDVSFKKLNLNKYSFLYYLKSDFYAWINCDENYLSLIKNNYSELIDLTPWRYKELTDRKSVDVFDKPSTVIDGLDTEKFFKEFYKKKYPDYKYVDLNDDDYNMLSVKEKIQLTEKLISENDKLLLFEGTFTYNDFRIKVDLLIKKDDKIKICELKAVTVPLYYHALDVMFQKMIISNNKYFIKYKWLFNLVTLNTNYTNTTNNSVIDNLFVEWNYYFNSKPSNLDVAIEKKNYNLISEIIYDDKWIDYFENFNFHLERIKTIQKSNELPKIFLEKRNFLGLDSDYENFYLKLAGAPVNNSIFDYFGDSGFNKWKKASFLIEGKKTIFDVDNLELVSKSNLNKLENETVEWLALNTDNFTNELNIKNDLKKNSKILKRIIQKYSFKEQNFKFINDIKLKNFIKNNFKKVVYMFDFETISQAVPRVKNCKVYEQVPYQYSIHIILDSSNFDFKTEKNIVHLEWLATDFEDFYNLFWENFVKDIQKYGDGTYVSYNKQFENMIIKNRLNKLVDFKSEEYILLSKIFESTIDLMDPFKELWFYAKNFNGSYSIKKVGPYFAPELDYKKLDSRVQKGDQSAKQCKIWLIKNNLEYNKKWLEIRKPMLEYCKYDTLLMVILFQKLLEIKD